MDWALNRFSDSYFFNAPAGFTLHNNNDTLTILNGALVGSENGDGVLVQTDNNTITNQGRVAGGAGNSNYGVDFQDFSAGMLTNDLGASIIAGTGVFVFAGIKTMVNDGQIIGFHLAGVDTEEQTNTWSLTNDGTVYGYADGIRDFGGRATVTNTGTGVIQSDTYGFELDSSKATITNDLSATISGTLNSIYTHEFGSLALTNFGTLDGDILCTVPDARNSIFNGGTINGSVIFQAGNAKFTDAGLGHVTGLIESGTGAGTFVAGKAKERFVAGTGADTFVFNSVVDSPRGAKHDVISNFSGFAGDVIDLHHILAAGAHLVFIGTDTFAHYHAVHPGVVGMVRFNPVAHQLQATVDGDFSTPDLVVSLPGVATFHAGELILV
jgi:hypothetical protein